MSCAQGQLRIDISFPGRTLPGKGLPWLQGVYMGGVSPRADHKHETSRMLYGSWNGHPPPVRPLAAEPPMNRIARQALGAVSAGKQSYFIAISRASFIW
jgi:hypothetical protein